MEEEPFFLWEDYHPRLGELEGLGDRVCKARREADAKMPGSLSFNLLREQEIIKVVFGTSD